MSVAERNQLILMLASYIRRRRQAMAMSVERAAELTGIKTSDWCVLEAGWVPEDESKLYNQEFLLSSPQPRAS
jgi:hypothetical protein